jgi:hypothetical protein
MFVYSMSGISAVDAMIPYKLVETNSNNLSFISDPLIDSTYAAMTADYFTEPIPDTAWAHFKEVLPYFYSQVYWIPLPAPALFVAWQPWVMDYHAEQSVGYYDHDNYAQYIWIDQSLK